MDQLLRNIAVPRSLVADAASFGGRASDDCLTGDLLLAEGAAPRMLRPGEPSVVIARDCGGRLVIPRLAEAHCHLDKCHTVGRLGPVGGDLHAAIAAQASDKARWTANDLRDRAGRGLEELYLAGCGAVRTHVDWDRDALEEGHAPLAWEVLGELAAAWRGRIVLQRAALIALDDLADRAAAETAARLIAESPGGVFGVFLFDQAAKRERLRLAFDLAAAYGLMLDFHVDEGLCDGLDGLAAIADLATTTRFTRPIVCGHACSLANLDGAALRDTIERVSAAGIGVVSLPATNLYLQDRCDGTPQRRGITRIRELAAAGVPLAIGSDNVQDAFCPLGSHDPLAALGLAALAAQLDPPYGAWLPAVTTAARRMIGLPPLFVDEAAAGDLLLTEARHTAALLAGQGHRSGWSAQWGLGGAAPETIPS